MDDREGMDDGQEENCDDDLPVSHEPVILEHGLYTRGQVLFFFGISPNTLSDWQKNGLPTCRRKTKRVWYSGRDLINFLRESPGGEGA